VATEGPNGLLQRTKMDARILGTRRLIGTADSTEKERAWVKDLQSLRSEPPPDSTADLDRCGVVPDLRRFYALLERLAVKVGGPRTLNGADGRMVWPRRGVYFFLDKAEVRSGSGTGPRVVRVGTHGLKTGSGSTLWGRLAQHRGSASAGNHRGSIFRLLVGLAIVGRDPSVGVLSWRLGSITDHRARARIGGTG
jgi:hypothetical protein